MPYLISVNAEQAFRRLSARDYFDLAGDDQVTTGKVKWFNAHKGYGFIQPDDGGEEVFVDICAVEKAGLRSLPEGTRLSYDLMIGRNGKRSADHLRTE